MLASGEWEDEGKGVCMEEKREKDGQTANVDHFIIYQGCVVFESALGLYFVGWMLRQPVTRKLRYQGPTWGLGSFGV